MELRHLRYFVAVAEELHFGRAAERVGIAQPPLSQQIRALEAELGVALFRRTKRRVELTEAGRLLLPEARLMLAQAERIVEIAGRAARGEAGHLAVGFVTSAAYDILPEILRRVRAAGPEVELTLRELTTAEQIQALADRRIQVGFLRPPVVDVTGLHVEPVLREPLLAALPEHHPLAKQAVVSLTALASERFILFPRQLGPGFHDMIVSLCRQAGFSPHVAQEAVEMPTIVSLVAGGMGVSLVPASVGNLRRLGVVYRPLEEPVPVVEIALAWRQDDPSPVLQRFIEVARTAAETFAGKSRSAPG